MRLLQLLGLTAFSLLILKLGLMISSDFFDELTVAPALAQEQSVETEPAAENNAVAQENSPLPSQDANEDLGNVEGIDKIRNRSSRGNIAKRLGERREALTKRERDLELREKLLAAAEERLKNQIAKLKEFEEKAAEDADGKRNKASKDLVTIYENMKPKDAAKIFNALSLDILHMLATSMNPRKVSAIIAEMDVKQAERLTVEIALRAAHGKGGRKKQRNLQKIGG